MLASAGKAASPALHRKADHQQRQRAPKAFAQPVQPRGQQIKERKGAHRPQHVAVVPQHPVITGQPHLQKYKVPQVTRPARPAGAKQLGCTGARRQIAYRIEQPAQHQHQPVQRQDPPDAALVIRQRLRVAAQAGRGQVPAEHKKQLHPLRANRGGIPQANFLPGMHAQHHQRRQNTQLIQRYIFMFCHLSIFCSLLQHYLISLFCRTFSIPSFQRRGKNSRITRILKIIHHPPYHAQAQEAPCLTHCLPPQPNTKN